jgi:hypothetical protein
VGLLNALAVANGSPYFAEALQKPIFSAKRTHAIERTANFQVNTGDRHAENPREDTDLIARANEAATR